MKDTQKPNILVMTPVSHINGLEDILSKIGNIEYLEDPSNDELLSKISIFDAIYTNPNKSNVYLGFELLTKATNLKVICTASTGTNHIDLKCAYKNNIKILALTEELDLIKKISSTAEHAFALTLSSLRNVVPAYHSVIKGEWDYTKFIGRQMNYLNVGVIGYGRLGKMYSSYCRAFGAKVRVFDPYKKVLDKNIEQLNQLENIFDYSDIISLHVHLNDETKNMINSSNLIKMKKDIIIINTSRGDIINEIDLVNFLRKNTTAKIATDVLADEILNKEKSPLISYAKVSNQVLITPHIGGMTREAQEIAYKYIANKLKNYFEPD